MFQYFLYLTLLAYCYKICFERSDGLNYPKNHNKKPPRYLRVLSVVCFCVALFLIMLTVLFDLPVVQKNLSDINAWFIKIEYFIAGYDWLKALVLLALMFFLKSIVPIIPFSIMFVSAGMVFPTVIAVFISTLGVTLLCSVKFFWGRRYGGGSLLKLICRSRKVSGFMGLHDNGNRWILSLLCFIPVFPIGAVSRAYGTTRMGYGTFIKLSLPGIMPRIILWSFVGVNIFEPFTVGFIAPFIILLVISGVSLLILDALLQGERIEKYEKESDNKS